MSTATSRVFNNGNSQAVRIPQEFRLNTSKVQISRTEEGDLVIHPIPEQRGDALFEVLCSFDEEFAKVLQEDKESQSLPQDREDL
ncbi:MAG: antitoxin VapB [Parasphingorhabdus sp.]|jgi:antitoxin VapB